MKIKIYLMLKGICDIFFPPELILGGLCDRIHSMNDSCDRNRGRKNHGEGNENVPYPRNGYRSD